MAILKVREQNQFNTPASGLNWIVLCSQGPHAQGWFPSHAMQAQTRALCTPEINWWLAGHIWHVAVIHSFQPQPTPHQLCKSQFLRQITAGATGRNTSLWPRAAARLPTVPATHPEKKDGHRTGTRDVPRHFISPPKHFLILHIHLRSLLRMVILMQRKKTPSFFLEPVVIHSSCIV